MLRVVLQDRHDEDEALEVINREYEIDFEMSALVARQRDAAWGKPERR